MKRITFTDRLEEHLSTAPLEECRDILKHAEILVRFRERQAAVLQEETAKEINERAKRLEEAARP